MAFPNLEIPELQLLGVFDPGVANAERIVLRPTIPMPLNNYAIAVGLAGPQPATAFPLFDNCFWFPNIEVTPPAWVVVYTGPGITKTTAVDGEAILSLHWQRGYTLFGAGNVVPILFRIEAAVVGQLLRSSKK